MIRPTILASIVTLFGCSQSVQDYQAFSPQLQLTQFFQGSSEAIGVMHDWQGKQSLRFVAELCGQWQGDRGDLYEIFNFSDGRIDKRHWQLTQGADGTVQGVAEDVVGEARGQLAGNTLYWEYTLRIPQDDDYIDVKVKDWLYLVSAGQVINRSTLHKFGFTVGELTLAIRQLQPQADCASFIKKYQATERTIPLAPNKKA
ncbi:MAG: DUF3833 domain-containing protein [Gammaproteobacteria bacterium]|nr:DUF3833 domain-containing protein [Gammaproteobacteria bacterium]MBU2180056.1 DUF3833 domain-containing protein [Gammaproteobacteria bacterium]MBU2428618.1 DUF3833 domain-containing protein [Gammaproteobacteria bacterium]